MAKNLQVNERVFVPLSMLDNPPDRPSAFLETTVTNVVGRSVDVAVGAGVQRVSASRCQRNIGLLVFNFGDLESESSLLDPLSKSVTQFCRLLAHDSYVRSFKARSLAELTAIWQREHAVHSHVIFVGHGNGTGMKLGVDGWCNAEQFGDALDVPGVGQKLFVSLACEAGRADFGQVFSELNVCAAFLGAFHSVHGAIASHFVQSFLAFHLLQGETTKVAFRHARQNVPGSTSFRLWRGGKLTTS